MARKVILTCAVTGGGDTTDRYKVVPITPKQIADASIEACKAGAAVAHIHVRNIETGKPSMDLELYREVVDRIRDSGSKVIINLTTGPGARFIPADEGGNMGGPGSTLRSPMERVRHITALKPDICSLDMGSLNFGHGALINVPSHIKVIAAEIRSVGVKPELEVFDTGHVALALDMIEKGLIEPNPIFQAVLGAGWTAPATTETMALFKALIPAQSQWAAFGIGRHEFPMVAQAVLLGGHVRVGFEDNFYLSKGVQAQTNAQLVEKAVQIVESLGDEMATPDDAREILNLPR